MRKVPSTALLFAVSFGACALPAPARADLGFETSVAVREDYNDNIFLTHNNEVSDFITYVNPALRLNYERGALKLGASYGFNFAFYAKHPEKNETSVDRAQRALVSSTFPLIAESLFLAVSDEYTRVPIDPRKPVGVGNLFVNQTDLNTFTGNPFWDHQWSGTLRSRFGYTYENVWFRSADADSWQNHNGMASITKDITGQLSATLSYNYRKHLPTKTDPYDTHNGTLGLNWQVTPKLTLGGTVGETQFLYRSTTRRDTRATVWSAQASYALSSDFSLAAGYTENFSDSVSFGTYKSSSGNASIAYLGRVPVKLTVSQSSNKYTDTNREDRSTGVGLDLSVPVSANVKGTMAANYTHYTFLPQNEAVDRITGSVGLDYRLRFLIVSLGYTVNYNESSHVENNYLNNIVFAQAKLTY